jgi:hypothetical protein
MIWWLPATATSAHRHGHFDHSVAAGREQLPVGDGERDWAPADLTKRLPAPASVRTRPEPAVRSEQVQPLRFWPSEEPRRLQHGSPDASAVTRKQQLRLSGGEQDPGAGWVDDQINEWPLEAMSPPVPATVTARKYASSSRVIADQVAAAGAQDVEVRLAAQRQ